MIGRGLLVIGIVAFQLAAATLAASDLPGGVDHLLTAGAKPSPKALDAARVKYKQLRKLGDFDYRTKYAYALVLVQQRRLDEARKVLGEVLDEHPEMLPAWQVKIWASLAGHGYATALADMRAAAAQVARLDAGSGGEVSDQRQALARLLGRGIGFLIATEKTKIPAEQLTAARQEILTKLGTDRAVFLTGQQMISSEMAGIETKLADVRQAQDAAVAQQQAEQSEKKRIVGKEVAEADYKLLKSRADNVSQMRSAEWEVEQLQLSLAKAQFALNQIDAAISLQQFQLQQTIQRLDQAQRDTDAGRIVNMAAVQINAMTIPQQNMNIRRLGEQHVVLSRQLDEAQTKLNLALVQRERLGQQSEVSATELESEAQKLKRTEKKLEYASKQTPRPASGARQALAEQRRAFSSFEPFDFDGEKERVLAWYVKAELGKASSPR